jgi:hypothetical protein
VRLDVSPRRIEFWAHVETNLEEGSIILKGKEHDVALVWKGKREARLLAPGYYRVRTTRIVRRKGKDHWFLSQTGPPLPPSPFEQGKTIRIEVGDSVHFKGHVKRKKDRLQLGFGIRGADGRGLSVYKNDKRVPVTYKLLSRDGRTLASGTMNYG